MNIFRIFWDVEIGGKTYSKIYGFLAKKKLEEKSQKMQNSILCDFIHSLNPRKVFFSRSDRGEA